MPEGMFQWAERYLKQGLCPIPLREGKTPAVRWTEFQSRLPSRRELGGWFIGDKAHWGMAIVCGSVSGNLVRLDFDDPADYDAFKGKLPKAPTFKSQRQGGGYGMLLKAGKPMPTLPQNTFELFPKLEVRAEGAITVVPPTPGYEWLTEDLEIPTIDVGDMLTRLFGYDQNRPKRLADRLSGKGSSAPDELTALLRQTDEGERSNNLVRIASMLRARGIDSETAVQVMELNFEEHWPKGGMDWDEAKAVFLAAYHRYAHEGARFGGTAVAAKTEAAHVMRVRFSDIRPKADRVLIERLVLAGTEGNTVIAAPTKMGKTSLLLDACISASKGEPAWGSLKVPRPLTIAFIDQELKYVQLKENMEKMAAVVGWPDEDCLQVLYNEDGQFQITDEAGLKRLKEELSALKPDLAVVDGWGWFVCHQASDPKLVMPALAWWKQVRQDIGCATVFIHHYKKEQRQRPGQPDDDWGDPLDMIEGVKRLSDQAQTVMGYTSIPHYDTYGLLRGRTNHTDWDPLQMVIDYDYTTLTHRVVTRDEGSELFDPDTFRRLWEVSTDSRWLKGALNVISNRLGLSQADLAAKLGVSQGQVSKWRSGLKNPSVEMADLIKELYEKARQTPLKAAKMPKGKED